MDHNRCGRLAPAGLAAIAAACVLAALGAPSADAAYLVRDLTANKSAKFSNPDECAPAAVAVALPRGASHVRVVDGPSKGEQLSTGGLDAPPMATVTGVRIRPQGRREVLWGAAPLPGACRPIYAQSQYDPQTGEDIPGPLLGYRWATDVYAFGVSYRLREQVRLTRRRAAGFASTALSRHFGGAYAHSDGYPRCRRPRRNRTTCSIGFFAGDVSWSGRVSVGVRTTRDHHRLRWFYRLNVLQVNEYCLAVNNGTRAQCTDRIRRSRVRLPVPGGRL